MSNFSEIISQLRSNQEAFESKLAKVEDLGANVSEAVLRDLIQNLFRFHSQIVIHRVHLAIKVLQLQNSLDMVVKEETKILSMNFMVTVDHLIQIIPMAAAMTTEPMAEEEPTKANSIQWVKEITKALRVATVESETETESKANEKDQKKLYEEIQKGEYNVSSKFSP